ncbi:substrate-binding domain-containing protein [Nostoc sp. DSM 114167]|jgi:molybdate transport system substrate-binding protein|uniref:substrate-binding domain-containing protein n=1 Tax=Nostoc sp. DSM 114167 TaxID=3439050 RepID=UPI004045E534
MKKYLLAASLTSCIFNIIVSNKTFAANIGTSPQTEPSSVVLFGAGSLRAGLSEVADDFTKENGIPVETSFNHSDIQRDRIIQGGEKPDIFASADTDKPLEVYEKGLGGPVVKFASNRLVAVTRADSSLTSSNFLEQLPNLRIGTPPDTDPLGYYAQVVYKKADRIKPGSFQKLNKNTAFFSPNKIENLGNSGLMPQIIPQNRNDSGGSIYYSLEESPEPVDVNLAYYTSALLALQVPSDSTSLKLVELPQNLAVKADYGLTVLNDASSDGQKLANYIISSNGQKVLAKYGFSAPSTSIPEPNTIGGSILAMGLVFALKKKRVFVCHK